MISVENDHEKARKNRETRANTWDESPIDPSPHCHFCKNGKHGGRFICKSTTKGEEEHENERFKNRSAGIGTPGALGLAHHRC
jgi:hypothetical protein